MESSKTRTRLLLNIVICLFCVQVNAQDIQADNMLLLQRDSGGWSKHFKNKAVRYTVVFSDIERSEIAKEVKRDDANIDNNATIKEIKYLVKAYKQYKNPQYLSAAEKGIRYLLKAQYDNGGWPQYYPDSSHYRSQITYNDNAMINVLTVLQDVVLKQNDFEVVDERLVAPSLNAVNKGIECILKTQIKVNGKLTGWCQQYDKTTLEPATARSYELPSIAGSESVAILGFLMSQSNPTPEIKEAINAAVEWFQDVKIVGHRLVNINDPNAGRRDRKLIEDSTSIIWARYYEIGTNRPFFSDRDGVKKYSIAEIGYERRNGYSWYGTWPLGILERAYPEWLSKNN
jgi:PelA/Pel-15E family pectate lyase